jgi:hypothetical protein
VTADTDPNEYSVEVVERGMAWEVRILDPSGVVVFSRPGANETEARTFASTVLQHIYWLSPAKFREYYRLPEPVDRA